MLFFRSLLLAAVCVIGGGIPFCESRPTERDGGEDVDVERRQNLRMRREWSDLSKRERIEYIDAVKCMMKTPSRLPKRYHSTNMYDDFVVVHINHTWQAHADGLFLGYHRAFLRVWEDALQTVCRYRGMQPYVHWPKYLDKPLKQSPLFDGSPSSFGSDGGTSHTSALSSACIASGPFHNYRVRYHSLRMRDAETGKPPGERAWVQTDDCLRRNLNDSMARTVANQAVIDAVIAAPNIEKFNHFMDSHPDGGSGYGIHSGTHNMYGGHMQLIFMSPVDSSFWTLHAQIDFMWMKWQALDPGDRVFGRGAVSGTRTMSNVPKTRNVTLDDMMNFGNLTPLGRDRSLREAMDVKASWLGYSYA